MASNFSRSASEILLDFRVMGLRPFRIVFPRLPRSKLLAFPIGFTALIVLSFSLPKRTLKQSSSERLEILATHGGRKSHLRPNTAGSAQSTTSQSFTTSTATTTRYSQESRSSFLSWTG